jgi:hypothetical protein
LANQLRGNSVVFREQAEQTACGGEQAVQQG